MRRSPPLIWKWILTIFGGIRWPMLPKRAKFKRNWPIITELTENMARVVWLSWKSEGEGGGPPRVTPSRGCHPNEKIYLWENLQRIVDKWGRRGKKRCGVTLSGDDTQLKSIKVSKVTVIDSDEQKGQFFSGVTPSVAAPGDPHPSDATDNMAGYKCAYRHLYHHYITLRPRWLSVRSCGTNSVYTRNGNRFSAALTHLPSHHRRPVQSPRVAYRQQPVVYKRHACFIAPRLPIWISIAIIFASVGRTGTKARRTRQFLAGTCGPSIRCRPRRPPALGAKRARGAVEIGESVNWWYTWCFVYCWCCQLS